MTLTLDITGRMTFSEHIALCLAELTVKVLVVAVVILIVLPS